MDIETLQRISAGVLLLLAFMGFMSLRRQHKHEFTNKLTVSGYGYTEYEVWFCKSCPQVFGEQTKAQR